MLAYVQPAGGSWGHLRLRAPGIRRASACAGPRGGHRLPEATRNPGVSAAQTPFRAPVRPRGPCRNAARPGGRGVGEPPMRRATSDLLLEIGVEALPARVCAPTLVQ